MFQAKKKEQHTPGKVQGRPSLGINVMGRAVKGIGGGVQRATRAIADPLAKGTKVMIRDPLAKVGTTLRLPGLLGTSGKNHASPFDIRSKIWPNRAVRRRTESASSEINLMSSGGSSTLTTKTEDQRDFLLKELRQNFLFSELGEERLHQLADAFETNTVHSGDTIIAQGEPGDYFYVLYQGDVHYTVDGSVVGTSHDSADTPQCFGDLALLFSAPRAASVVAETKCILFQLDQANFRLVVESQGQAQDQQRVGLLKSVPVLQELDDVSLNKLVSAMSPLEFSKGDVLFEKGDHMTDFFIVTAGKVHATQVLWGGSQYEDVLIGPGESQRSFGWRAMTKDEPLFARITAETSVQVLAIQGGTFRRVVGRHDELLERLELTRQIKAIAVFRDSKLEDHQIQSLLDLMKHEQFTRQQVIIHEGSVIDASITFVRKGKVTITSKVNKTTQTMEHGAFFGQDWMLADQNKEIQDDDRAPLVKSKISVTVHPGTNLDFLTLEDARKVVNTTLLGLGKPVQVSGLDDTIQVKDVQRHKMLGAGSFGQVWLASYGGAATPKGGGGSNKKDKQHKQRLFALKVQSKHQLIESGQAEGVIAECNIMKSFKSPFIIRLYATFQDPQRVYMLTSLLQGGELEAVMGDKPLQDSVARFYAAGILEGLTYMHRRHIIHRDLKPENVLINSKGYPVLIDLGFAKYVPDKTYTFCGTPMYIAPEVIQYKGHDKGADYWSWACLVFEMVTAKYPFYEGGMAELDLFKKICRGQFKVYGFMSFEVKLLIISLFIPDPKMRLGARPSGWQDLYQMPFFRDFDFSALRSQSLPAPWVPELKNPLDSSNFQDCSAVEDKMTATDPKITAEQQQMFKPFGTYH